MRGIFSVFLAFGVLAFYGTFALADAIEVGVEDNIGGVYELEVLDEGIKVFSDRDHIYKEVPEKYTDGGYTFIRCPVESVRPTPDIDIVFNLPVSCRVYVLWYKQGEWGGNDVPHDPSDWLLKDYEKIEGDIFVWGPVGGTDYKHEVWKSKTVFPAGEFHTYTSGNNCAYTVFAAEEAMAVKPSGKLSMTWGCIKSLAEEAKWLSDWAG